MNKSQLRKLAGEFADGLIPAGEYRTRRRELIDDIVSGRTPIARETPPTPPSPPAAPPRVRGPSGVPLPLALAAGSALCLALLAWLLWPSPEPAPPAVPVPPVVRAPEVPRARTLVESFVALRNFGEAAIAQFRIDWDALDPQERDAARDEPWFRSLVQSLRDEVKTQKALAGLAGGDAALVRAQRVIDLGEHLGIASQLPALEFPADPAPAAVPAADTPAPVARVPAAPAAQAPAPLPARLPPPASGPAAAQPTGREWLAARADDELTLQVFAVNSLDRIEQLLTRHPDLSLQILAADGASPRYRVFHGVFADTEAARAAYARLPADVTAAAGGAIVKSFSAVREDLGERAAPATSRIAPAGGDYTLQLFASNSRANAEALVGAFPALGLELREVNGDPAPYRVVYGRYASAQDARGAAGTLPGPLLSRIGKPLAKAVSETGVGVH